MIRFSIFGFEISATFGFLFFTCIFLLNGSPYEVFTAASACIIHELGHCFAAVILNVKFSGMTLWSGGIRIKSDDRIISYGSEIAVLIFGPLFNIIFAAISVAAGIYGSAAINITLAVFNLLPYSSLDGGCIIKAFFDSYEKNGGFIQKITAVFFGIFIIFLCLLTGNLNIALISAIVLLMADELI